MSMTLILSKSDVETIVLTPEATDETLIDTAREFNASHNGHMKRSMEDFWRLGATLSHLFQRRHLKGRWADVLKQVGINVTTDNHARRLSQATTLDGLSEFKNKTQALRFFGILSTPTPSVQVRAVSPPEASDDEFEEYTESPGEEQISVGHEENCQTRATTAERPESRAETSKTRQAVETAQVTDTRDDAQTLSTTEQATAQKAADSLERLVKIANQLEYLVADEIEVTPDHLVQLDRMLLAIELIRTKGVVDAA